MEAWKKSVQALGLDRVCQTPYQARHGGPSRDLQAKLRTEAKVAARWWCKKAASVRNYAKPARMNRVAQQAGKPTLEYGEIFGCLSLAATSMAPLHSFEERWPQRVPLRR